MVLGVRGARGWSGVRCVRRRSAGCVVEGAFFRCCDLRAGPAGSGTTAALWQRVAQRAPREGGPAGARWSSVARGQFRHLSVHRAEAHGQSRPSFSRLRIRSAPESVSESVLTTEHSRLYDDDVVTAADAAQIAQRSIRTIRRAYLSGKLLAHRDGNGRGVRIRYADLRAWLLAQPIRPAREQPASRPVARINVRKRPEGGAKTENLELLTAARERRGRAARVSGAGRPAGVRPPPRPA
jgi:hypothetical protein